MKFLTPVILLTIATFSNSPCFAADTNSSALSVDRQSPTTDVVKGEDTQSAPPTTDPKTAETPNPTPQKSTCSSADN
jgi:hypothetical protein